MDLSDLVAADVFDCQLRLNKGHLFPGSHSERQTQAFWPKTGK